MLGEYEWYNALQEVMLDNIFAFSGKTYLEDKVMLRYSNDEYGKGQTYYAGDDMREMYRYRFDRLEDYDR